MTPLRLIAALDEDTVLRPPEVGDVDGLFRCIDANREHLGRWLAWVDACRSPEDTLEFIYRVDEMHTEGSALTDVIVHRGSVVGVASTHAVDWVHFSAGIGYWVSEAHQGRGYVTRAVQAILRHMFEELSLHRAEIRCAPENRRSRVIPERLGFTREGTLREAGRLGGDRFVDLIVYSLLEQEWRERQ